MKNLISILFLSTLLLGCSIELTDNDSETTAPSTQTTQTTPSPSTDFRSAATGETCGTIAGVVCKSDVDYCMKPVGTCQTPDMHGVCTTKTQACTRELRPVCGCDGKSYGNACTANAAGVNVLHSGNCN